MTRLDRYRWRKQMGDRLLPDNWKDKVTAEQDCDEYPCRRGCGRTFTTRPARGVHESAHDRPTDHGTVSGYRRHREVFHQEPCDACKAAYRHDQPCDLCDETFQSRSGLGSHMAARHNTTLSPCGTRAAYARHRRNGEDPCEPCRAAKRDYQSYMRSKS